MISAENMSDELADYITMTLDPNVGNLVSFMKEDIPLYQEKLDNLQTELEDKLTRSGISLIELYEKIAMK